MGMAAPNPADERARVEALVALELLDTSPEQEFDAIVKLAAEICGVPIALVSLIDEHRQWFKAKVGLDALETPRAISYCAHAIMDDRTMIVPDASLDPRFSDNPWRLGPPHVQFYAGVPLRTSTGHKVGTLCVIDNKPRSLSVAQQVALEALAAQVVRLFELKRAAISQRDMLTSIRNAEDTLRRGANSHAVAGSREWSRSAFALACVLAAGSVMASVWVRSTIEDAGATRLRSAAERAQAFLEERAHSYGEIARGAGAFFRASTHVSPAEFRAYTESLELKHNFPGLLGLGYAELVPRDQLEAWTADARREIAKLEVHTSGDAAELVINRLIEPARTNRAAIGFDVLSEPVRARALAASRRTHDLALTQRVELLQDPRGGPGFVMYMPVVSVQEEAAPIAGWAFAAVRARDLLDGIVRAAGQDVSLRVIDQIGEPPLYGPRHQIEEVPHVANVRIADRSFRLETRPGPGFYSLSDRTEPWAILILGLSATMLSFALTNAMRRIEARSKALAMRMTQALRRGERELRAVIDGTADLVVTFAPKDGRILLTNRSFRQVLGYDDVVTRGMTLSDFVHPDAWHAFEDTLREGSLTPTTLQVQTMFRSRAGGTIEVDGALSFFVENGRVITRGIFRDISARRHSERALLAANAALERLATTDGLTGVLNRRAFDARLWEELARARRAGTAISIALLDVDCFKLYNDAYGHIQGDECLKQIGACLRATTRRAGELAARYGGEEFILLLPGCDALAAAEMAHRLRDSIEALRMEHRKHPLGIVTASLGVASFDAHTMASNKDLITAADAALYRAKAAGRNRVERAA
jgi:diguanylate cyclase (GGDEF)-like protein/PAS domain S-box-containing protein